MATQRKIDFLIKQGFDKDLIETLIGFGVDKQLLWFLTQYKKEQFNLDERNIRAINELFENPIKIKKDDSSKKFKKTSSEMEEITLEKKSYFEVLMLALQVKADKERKQNNILYTLKNGYYFSKLDPEDLKEEAEIMGNCVYSHYSGHVKEKTLAILALKKSNGKTVGHIEVKINGLIAQNFGKANVELTREHWKMVLEFFQANSKNINLSNAFGQSYVVVFSDLYIKEVSLSVPTEVHMRLVNGKKELDTFSGFQIKRFVPSNRARDIHYCFLDKQEVVKWVEQKKQELITAYDNMILNIMDTDASRMYLSDEIKEKLFGKNYFLKGDSYNISEIEPNFCTSSITNRPDVIMDRNVDVVALEQPEIGNEDNLAERLEEAGLRLVRITREDAIQAGIINQNEVPEGQEYVEIEVPNGLNPVDIVDRVELVDEQPEIGEIMPPEPFDDILANLERRVR